jgi:ribulose bisphosphate carboxylase small subunit
VNITRKGEKVVMEMTNIEAMEMRNALRFAKNYWQERGAQVTTSDAQEVMVTIAKEYARAHNEIADVIGY